MSIIDDTGAGMSSPSPMVGSGPYRSSAGDVWELRANQPLWLVEQSMAWRVSAGKAQLFAVRHTLDGTRGSRYPLFEVAAGAVILPFPDGSPFDMVAVGIETGTAAVAETVRSLCDLAGAGGAAAGEVRNLVETWAEALVGLVAVPNPRDGVELRPPSSAAPDEDPATWLIKSGEVAWSVRRTTWIEAAGDFLLYGSQSLAGAPASKRRAESDLADSDAADPSTPGSPSDSLLIPLPVGAWLQATSDSVIRPIFGDEALARLGGWRGLAALELAALRILDDRLANRDVEAKVRLERRQRVDESLVADSYRQLTSILEPGQGALGVSAAGDELFGAFQLVGEAMGVAVNRPHSTDLVSAGSSTELIARASGLRTRDVVLDEHWWTHDIGPLVASMVETAKPVAILSTRPGRYEVVDPLTRARKKVDKDVAATIGPVATMLYRPLPSGALSGRDVLTFAVGPIRRELAWMTAFGLVAGAMSLVTPLVMKTIFSSVGPGLDYANLYWLTALLGVFAVSSFAIEFAQEISWSRLEGRSSADLQAALWDRVLDLPLPFFRRFSAGALTQRVMAIEQIRGLATETVSTALIAAPVGLFNLMLAFVLEPRLALFGSSVLLVAVIVMVLFTRYQIVQVTKMTEANQRLFGLALQLVDAVGKLRVANAERRAFSQWANRFASLKKSFYASQLGFVGIVSFSAGVSGLVILVIFVGAATLPAGAIPGSTFIAFNAAFIQATAAVLELSGVAVFVAHAVPLYRSARPILLEQREVDDAQTDPGELTGRIEVSHVTLRYGPDAPPVLDDLSFSVEPGEFVALVGPSGAGKSTILRLLLGLEKPELGTVRYDGKDLESLDPRALRHQLGVVTQSVQLFPGSILANIIGNRQLAVDDAWEAAETAGIAGDIRAMPMGMQTFVSEGGGTFSGGQRQRILIARAVVAKPRILFFDEATSALDNQTQSHVAAAIASLRATRVVIAHRLSTIRGADRIIVLTAGGVVQQGTYEALMAEAGPFKEFAQRQLV